MAFIVPVMKKDYNLYAGSPKGTVIRAKVGRSNSSPVKVSLPAERIFMERRPTRNSYEHRHSVPAVPASNFANRRRNSRRVSVRHLSSTESTESTCTDDSKRRVRFGICEEYEYESSDEEAELEHLHDRTKKTSLPNVGALGTPSLPPVRAKSRTLSLSSSPAKDQMFKLSTLLRLAKLCSPAN